MASSLSSPDTPVNDIKYEYQPEDEKFLRLDIFNIVEYLYSTGLLNDIECRKIVTVEDLVVIQGAMSQIISTKDTTLVTKILEVFRRRLHPFQNPVILRRIFSNLKYDDLANCKRVSPYWKEIINSLMNANNKDANLDQFLLKLLSKKNEKIEIRKPGNDYYRIETTALASVFQMMLALNPENDETVLEILQIGKNFPHVNNSSINDDCTSENKSENLIASVMINSTVLSNIFQFLSFASIKNCRIVCHTWNAVAEPFLRRHATVKLDHHLRPADFINVSKYLSLPDLPFKAFKFARFARNRSKTEKNIREGLSEFFTKFGKNIQSLEMDQQWNIRSYLSNTCNLTELKLQRSEQSYYSYDIRIPWNTLHSIKILCLMDAVIDVDSEINLKRISPLKVHLNNVKFYVAGSYTSETILNDYIDFKNVTDINLKGYLMPSFDWSRDTFKAERVTISEIRFLNIENSKSSVDYLDMFNQHSFSEKMGVSVKQLIFGQARLSLATLPTSVEKLAICQKESAVISFDQPIYFPNLNYLCYGKGNEFHLLSLFDNCPNLTDIEILDMELIDIRWLPGNVKRVKVYSLHGKFTIFAGSREEHFDLDLLILNFVACRRLKFLKFDLLRPKVLVLQVRYMYIHQDFVSFLKRNRDIEKIYVEFRLKYPLGFRSVVFNDRELSKIVDKESRYYEFSNERGKAITSEEFFIIQRSLDMKTAMKEFWNSKKEEHISQNYENLCKRFQETDYYDSVGYLEGEDDTDTDSDEYY